MLGCLPTLATIPVWIGLYQALSNVANEVHDDILKKLINEFGLRFNCLCAYSSCAKRKRFTCRDSLQKVSFGFLLLVDQQV